MNALYKPFALDKIVMGSLIGSGFFLVLCLLMLLFFYKSLPPFLPLFNQMPWGDDRLGTTRMLAIPFVLSMILLGGNSICIRLLYEKMPLACRILAITSFLVILFFSIFLFRTLQLVL